MGKGQTKDIIKEGCSPGSLKWTPHKERKSEKLNGVLKCGGGGGSNSTPAECAKIPLGTE